MNNRKSKVEKWVEEIIRKTSEEGEQGYFFFNQKHSSEFIKIPVKEYTSGDNPEQPE